MRTKTRTNEESTDPIVDVPANDLVLLGTDAEGFNHHFDEQNERVIVGGERDEYGSGRLRVRLTGEIDCIQEPVTGDDLDRYRQFVDERRGWESWDLVTISIEDIMGAMGRDA